MQDRIGGFLGELTEELGWTPKLEHARVKPATTETTMQRPRVLTPDDDSPELWATPVERLQAEVSQLRSTVKPLGSEVINLRAQMAKLRSVPVPPDAEDVEAAEIARARPRSGQDESTPTQSTWYDFYRPTQEDESHTISTVPLSAGPGVEQGERPWPPRLIPVPPRANATIPEPATVSEHCEDTPVGPSEPRESRERVAVDASETPTSATPNPSVETDSTTPAHEAADRGPAEPPTSEPESDNLTTAPTIIEIDDAPESGPELFPSEPDSPTALAAGVAQDGSTGPNSRSRRKKRKRRDWTGARF